MYVRQSETWGTIEGHSQKTKIAREGKPRPMGGRLGNVGDRRRSPQSASVNYWYPVQAYCKKKRMPSSAPATSDRWRVCTGRGGRGRPRRARRRPRRHGRRLGLASEHHPESRTTGRPVEKLPPSPTRQATVAHRRGDYVALWFRYRVSTHPTTRTSGGSSMHSYPQWHQLNFDIWCWIY